EVLAHAHNVEVVGEHKSQHHQGHRKPHQLVVAGEDDGEVPHQPGGHRLGHLVLVGEVVGDAADDVAEHDAHQGYHDNIFKLDALDEPDENPGTQNGAGKGEQRPAPQGGGWHKQQGQQNAKPGRGNDCPGGEGDKLVAAQLLHEKTRHAHTYAC